jgi:hypothetical protein
MYCIEDWHMRFCFIAVISMLGANCSPGDGALPPGVAPTSNQLRDAMQELHNSIIDVAACEASDRLSKQQLAAYHSAYEAVWKALRSPDLKPVVRSALAQAQPLPVMKLCPEGDVAPLLARYLRAVEDVRSLLRRAK